MPTPQQANALFMLANCRRNFAYPRRVKGLIDKGYVEPCGRKLTPKGVAFVEERGLTVASN